MDRKQIIEIATDAISKHYPEMEGVEPEIETMDTGIVTSTFAKVGIPPTEGQKIWVATFRKEVITEEGLPINRITRVTLDKSGKVIKISESK
ncbi:hypothetical protein KAT89_04995 [candidate division WOR-3 bacterium]|nr:hypothetical protein [candidate division WOR-3 bacterium]